MKVTEPATDLGGYSCSTYVCAKHKVIAPNSIIIGEIGLTGEIRPVFDIETRIREAIKLGIKNAILSNTKKKLDMSDIEISYFKNILLILNDLF